MSFDAANKHNDNLDEAVQHIVTIIKEEKTFEELKNNYCIPHDPQQIMQELVAIIGHKYKQDIINAMEHVNGIADVDEICYFLLTSKKLQNSECGVHLDNCNALKRLENVLKSYKKWTSSVCLFKQNDVDIATIICGEYSICELLNDFHHLMYKHSFDEIYKCLKVKCNAFTHQCGCLLRNNRDRSAMNDDKRKELYFGCTETEEVITQQTLDRIHCYLCHSYDCGLLLTQTERKQTIENENKEDNFNFNFNMIKLHSMLSKKQSLRRNVCGDVRSGVNNKYSFGLESNNNNDMENKSNELQTMVSNTVNTYDFGIRYCYFNEKGGERRWGSDVYHISPIYSCIKTEMLRNKISPITITQWNDILKGAENMYGTDKAKSIIVSCDHCVAATARARIKNGEQISLNHLCSVLIYCNNDKVQYEFSKTYRKLNDIEGINSLIKRHSEFAYLGYFLRNAVWQYGTSEFDDNYSQMVYHGIPSNMLFTGTIAFINGPFSTTSEIVVAVNFSANNGIVLQLSMDHISMCQPQQRYFDCDWISDYPNEKEKFFLDSSFVARKFIIHKIIDTKTNEDYKQWMHCFNLLQDLTTYYEMSCVYPQSTESVELLVGLIGFLCNEYLGNNTHPTLIQTLPDYINKVIKLYIKNKKVVTIRGITVKVSYSLVKPLLFLEVSNSCFVKLDVLLSLFPNCKILGLIDFTVNDSLMDQIYDSLQSMDGIALTKIMWYRQKVPLQSLNSYKQIFRQIGWNLTAKHGDIVLEFSNNSNPIYALLGGSNPLPSLMSAFGGIINSFKL
eukprot:114267_1